MTPHSSKVLDQLWLLWAFHGPAEVWSGHVPDSGHLRRCGHPSQSHRHGGHECVWAPALPVCFTHLGWYRRTFQPVGALR